GRRPPLPVACPENPVLMPTEPIAAPAELIAAPLARAQVGLWTDAWRRLRRNRLALVATVYLTLLILLALVAIVHTPYSTSHQGGAHTYSPPHSAHPLGSRAPARHLLTPLSGRAELALGVRLTTHALARSTGAPPPA